MADFIYAKQQMSTPTEAAAGFRGWSFAPEDPHPPVRHVNAGSTYARGLPAQVRHKNEEKPVHFIPGISNSRPSHQVPVPAEQWNSKPKSSSSPPVGFIREAKAELKEKAQKVFASLIRGK